MLIPTGIKATLSVRKGSEVEFSVNGIMCGDETKWYCGILERNLGKTEKAVISVRILDPLLKQNLCPPIIKTTVQRLIRPVPPPDPFPDSGFEVGDVINALHDGGWWSGSVIKVLRNQRYLVYLDDRPGAIEFERKNMRPHMIWECDEWFRCEKRPLVEADFSKGKWVEVRTEVDNLGDVWSEAQVMKENEDGTLLVKLWRFDTEESFPYSKIRPSRPYSFRSETFNLMDKVDAHLEYKCWCPGVVSKLTDYQYVVDLGPKKESKRFTGLQLRPSLEWKDGLWVREEKVLESEESPHEGKITPNALATDQEVRETHSCGDGAMVNPSPTSSYGVDVSETGKVSVAESQTEVPDTATAPEETKNREVVNKRKRDQERDVLLECITRIESQISTLTKELEALKGRVAASQEKDGHDVDKGGKTSPRDVHKEKALLECITRMESLISALAKEHVALKGRVVASQEKDGHDVNKGGKKLKPIKNQKGSANDSNGSKAANIELANMTDDNRPLAPSGQSVENTTKHVDVVETPPTEVQTELQLNEQARVEEHSDYVSDQLLSPVASDEIGEESNAMNEAQGSVKCREGYKFEFDLNMSLFPSQEI